MKTQSNTRLVCIVFLAIIGLAVGVIAAAAQNVPATAREAASMPQFAARLAHPATPQHQAPQHQAPAQRRGSCSLLQGSGQRAISPLDNILYSNGPINGTTDAWTINFGFVTADSFPVPSGGGSVGGFSFGAWLEPGDVLQSVEVSITSQPFGGTTYFAGVVSFSQSNCSSNQYGYNVCTESGSFSGPNLSSGTYWVNLQNATDSIGDPVYWDENSGPSLAENNSVGTIPSEAFTVLGGSGNACMPERQGNFQVIHDFSGEGDGASPSGVAIDPRGNLYGPAGSSGGAGTVFKLAEAGTGWLLSTLYNFLGGNNGSSPNGVIVGPNGILYGAAESGNFGCGHDSNCGLIFDLRPTPNVCRSTSCFWTENVLFSFSGPTDAWGGTGLVADQAGNLYGVSQFGGVLQQGVVFELSPSLGGWVESILYNFTGGSDGGQPTTLLLSNDGNLYGMAETGGANASGVVFRLTPAANGWTEAVISDLPYTMYGSDPHALIQDSGGNLFGEWDYWYQEPEGSGETLGVVFMLSPSNGNWIYTELARGAHQIYTNDIFDTLILDAAGNLWGTGGGAAGCLNPVLHGYIFELARTNNGWQYSTPVYWDNTDFSVSGATAMDAHNNLYGTTYDCGTHNQGTVWEFSTQ